MHNINQIPNTTLLKAIIFLRKQSGNGKLIFAATEMCDVVNLQVYTVLIRLNEITNN